jgi:hypothetical protein
MGRRQARCVIVGLGSFAGGSLVVHDSTPARPGTRGCLTAKLLLSGALSSARREGQLRILITTGRVGQVELFPIHDARFPGVAGAKHGPAGRTPGPSTPGRDDRAAGRSTRYRPSPCPTVSACV